MGRTQIISLLENGSVLFKYPLKAYYRTGEGEPVFSVPKRHFKRAVKRNLLKRRMREAYRKNKSALGGKQVDLMLVYNSKEIVSYEKISENVTAILEKIAGVATDKAD